VGEVAYDGEALLGMVPRERTSKDAAKTLGALLEQHLDALPEWSAVTVETALRAGAEAEGWPPKDLYMTVRLAVTGRAATPPLFETMAVLGKEVCRRRLRRAAETLLATKAKEPLA